VIPRTIYLAVFLSGFASLGYELCWIRKASLLIGATPQALSIVVAVFFGGMATGAWLFGLLSKRAANPLRWYGILECAIGIVAALTPFLFSLGGVAAATVYSWGGSSLALHLLLRAALVAALIFPASVLIGGTLPLLCQFYIHNRGADIRITPGILYAVNTAGAFFGCILCGILFIPSIGINAAIWCNAAISGAVGLTVINLSRTFHGTSAHTKVPSKEVSSPSASIGDPALKSGFPITDRIILFSLFFLAGFTALGYELLWVRFLSLIIHNTVYTAIFTLGALLLGIALGGWLVTLVKSHPRQDVIFFGAVNICIAFSVLLILLQPVAAWEFVRNSRSVPMQALLCTVLILVPSIASGISFPLAYRMVTAARINSGRDFGSLTAVNTLGGIAGSLLVGFYLLPSSGMYATVIILTCISLTIGTYCIFAFAAEFAPLHRAGIAIAATLLWFGVIRFGSTKLPEDYLAAGRPLFEYAEGISSFIAVVTRDGIKTLEIDRLWQGQNPKGHQILAAHIPMILHQDPKKVLVIGIGTGQTASRFLMYDIKRLDCVDIEQTLPGILQRHFDAAWLGDPRTHVITDDGRNFTASTKTSYDIISIEVGQSFRPQLASFYTVDFYRDVKKQLTKTGLACQFVPVGFFNEREFRGVLRSFLEVFPQSTLWFNKYGELLLIGNAIEQPQLSTARLGLLQSDRILRSDLEYSFDDKPLFVMNQQEVFAANFLMGARTLAKLAAAAPLYDDDLPILEYRAAQTLYEPGRLHGLIENNLETPGTIFARTIPAAAEATIAKIRAETVHRVLAEGR
jgi:spermidine synthase